MRVIGSHSLAYLCTIFKYFQHIESSKQRSWHGPAEFLDGIVPSERWLYGFATVKEGLYIFGGSNGYGILNASFLVIKYYLITLHLQENI